MVGIKNMGVQRLWFCNDKKKKIENEKKAYLALRIRPTAPSNSFVRNNF